MPRLPAWLALLLFVPFQVWIFLKLVDAWGIWKTIGTFLVLGFLATRAARANMLRALLFPNHAQRWEERRHVFQGILLLLAGVTYALSLGPQPWLALAALLSLLKASLR